MRRAAKSSDKEPLDATATVGSHHLGLIGLLDSTMEYLHYSSLFHRQEPAMTTSEPNPVTPLPFVDALLGYHRTAALKAAIELGVFEAIGADGADVEAFARKPILRHVAFVFCATISRCLASWQSPEPSGGRHL